MRDAYTDDRENIEKKRKLDKELKALSYLCSKTKVTGVCMSKPLCVRAVRSWLLTAACGSCKSKVSREPAASADTNGDVAGQSKTE